MRLLLVGASGLVGSHVLRLALADARIEGVTAPTRRPLAAHPKLHAPQVEFDALPADAPWWSADAVICTLGTTIRKAGSRAAFRRVDYDYPLAAARLARQQGTPAFCLTSAFGAHPASRFFYNRVKGELERDLRGMGFDSLTLVRPGLIGGQREELRIAERSMAVALTLLQPILPRQWRINPAANIARALLESAIAARPGVEIIGPAQLAAP